MTTKISVPTVAPEPVYEFVKGKGWVINHVRPFPQDLTNLCNNCGKRAGLHRAGIHLCPADWNTYLETKWA